MTRYKCAWLTDPSDKMENQVDIYIYFIVSRLRVTYIYMLYVCLKDSNKGVEIPLVEWWDRTDARLTSTRTRKVKPKTLVMHYLYMNHTKPRSQNQRPYSSLNIPRARHHPSNQNITRSITFLEPGSSTINISNFELKGPRFKTSFAPGTTTLYHPS